MSDLPTGPNWFSQKQAALLDGFSPRIVGMNLIRSAVEFIPPSSDDSGEPEFDEKGFEQFALDVVFNRGGDENDIFLFSECAAAVNNMFVGISTFTRIEFPSKELASKVHSEHAEALGYWAVHPIYDFSAQGLRSMIAATSELIDVIVPASPSHLTVTVTDYADLKVSAAKESAAED